MAEISCIGGFLELREAYAVFMEGFEFVCLLEVLAVEVLLAFSGEFRICDIFFFFELVPLRMLGEHLVDRDVVCLLAPFCTLFWNSIRVSSFSRITSIS